MLSEIGSNYWIDPNAIYDNQISITPDVFKCNGTDYVWLSTGRSAISLVLETIKERDPGTNKVALIPSYTCHTVVEPFIKAGYEVKSIPIDRNLRTQGTEMLKAVKENDAAIVLFHHYFGFETLINSQEEINEIKKHGVKVIEDRTQCLYSDLPTLNVDYFVGSIRKWFGAPDGGFAVCTQGKFVTKPKKVDLALENSKIKASTQKYDYLFKHEGEKEDFLAEYRKAENILDNQQKKYAIGELSIKMQASLNIEELSNKRRQNYLTLLNGINRFGYLQTIFPELPADVTPMYFPILTEERHELQRHLANNSIYAPIIWPKADFMPDVCNEANELYDKMLCLPIDQRYGHEDMKRIIDCLSSE